MYFKKSVICLSISLLTACGGSSSSSSSSSATASEPLPESFTLLDPNEAAENRFGIRAVELANGNLAIRSRGLSVGSGAGAVHLYKPSTNTLIKSFYGDSLNYELGLTLKPLKNGNLVIASQLDHPNGVSDAGSVMLIDGNTGAQIGSSIVGDNPNDQIGGTGITALDNGNFVIASRRDSINSINQAGSVMLINGTTGAQIGSTIYGDSNFDNIGDKIKELANGNFVIASPQADNGGANGTGSVILVDGVTGLQIGSTFVGDQGADLLGSAGVFALDNGNYVIASPFDDHAGKINAGTAMLFNGTTGVKIATAYSGINDDDQVANKGVVPLANNEFMVSSTNVQLAGGTNRGAVRFFNGTTGAQIGFQYNGSLDDDFFGSGSKAFQLANGNIVVSSPSSSLGLVDSGRVNLIDGATKSSIVSRSVFQLNAQFGLSGVKDLKNGNFVVVSELEDDIGAADVGSVRVYDGATGAQVGSTFFGDNPFDLLGNAGVTVLENGNFVVASNFDDVNGISNAGSVMLFNGTTGAQIGTSITGTATDDELARDGVFALKGSSNYVIASSKADANGLSDVGSVILVDGNTGAQIGDAVMGDDAGDLLGGIVGFGDNNIMTLANGDYLITNIGNDDNGNADVGKVLYQSGK